MPFKFDEDMCQEKEDKNPSELIPTLKQKTYDYEEMETKRHQPKFHYELGNWIYFVPKVIIGIIALVVIAFIWNNRVEIINFLFQLIVALVIILLILLVLRSIFRGPRRYDRW